MGMTKASKHELTMALRNQYGVASHAEKGRLLDVFCEVTGYHRKYALTLLRHGPPVAHPRLVRSGRPLLYCPLAINALQGAKERSC